MVKKLHDQYLIYLLKCGNGEAQKIFFDRYIYLSKVIAGDFYRNNYLPGMTADDISAIYISNIHVALCFYNEKIGNFKAFWKQISYHESMKTITENMRHYRPGNISLDQIIDEDGETTVDEIIGFNDEDISIKLAIDDVVYQVEENEDSVLTSEEREVFLYYTMGFSYQEIADKRECDIKHIRYIYSRAKKKLAETTNFK
jgi:DNA-directed RNA polymerase specialized sigma24 family protein